MSFYIRGLSKKKLQLFEADYLRSLLKNHYQPKPAKRPEGGEGAEVGLEVAEAVRKAKVADPGEAYGSGVDASARRRRQDLGHNGPGDGAVAEHEAGDEGQDGDQRQKPQGGGVV